MSNIEWTGETWNPIVGCSKVSPGCANCYAEKMARRLVAMGQSKYVGAVDGRGRWTGEVWYDAPSHEIPLQVKTPRIWFVNSMSDLFHEKVSLNWQMRIWEMMAKCYWHTFQILTKRADEMLRRVELLTNIYGELPNVWLGVSVETQKYADKRVPLLCQTSAAVRFLSCEPLLEHVSLTGYLNDGSDWLQHLHWVITGGESGSGAREFNLGWGRDIIDQCRAFNVPVFVKQVGANPVQGVAESKASFIIKSRKGNDMNEWPEDLRVREMPAHASASVLYERGG